MQRITNISATERAAIALDKRRALVKLAPDEVFELGYISSFVNADGAPVDGFVPGYVAGASRRPIIGSHSVLARLSSGIEFYFLPRFRWNSREHYVLDMAGGLYETYSIAPKRPESALGH
jgi:hypothetical protein